MSRLHISHPPGSTIADAFYRKIELFFPADSYEKRMEILLPEIELTGIKYNDLENDVKRSLTLITDIEALPRLTIKKQPKNFYYEIDAIATSLRLSRALAQRRDRGKEIQSQCFKLVAHKFLLQSGLAQSEVGKWYENIDFLADDKRTWNMVTIVETAESMPVVYLLKVIERQINANWFSAVKPITALHWVSQDLSQLLYSSPPRLHHVGPISDLIADGKKDDPEYKDRIDLSIYALDMYAEQVHNILEEKEPHLPMVVRNYTKPIYEYAKIVFSGLQQQGYV
jgi:hypothetical protein